MGQPITVVEKPTTTPGVVRFETNRSLTGTGHERYVIRQDITGLRPPDELARRLFARGGVEAVHVYSNVITVNLAAGADSTGLREIVEELFIHYRPGVVPPTDEELTGAGTG
ncbi:MAG TPA: NifU N-terminal domain-containing protein [Acidimicrobiales bacterium]|nr:NifU N-terminal domain-containing protein [Acidimicrobiales bacterium]